MKIKIEVLQRSGWWQVRVCGLRHSTKSSESFTRQIARQRLPA
jgi:hypothetical protein